MLTIIGTYTTAPQATAGKAAVILASGRPLEPGAKCDALTSHGRDPGRGGGPTLVAFFVRPPNHVAHAGYGMLSHPLRQLDQAAADEQAVVEVQERSASLGGSVGLADRAVEEDQAATTPGLDS